MFEVEPSGRLFESTRIGDEIKELTTSGEFQDNIINSLLLTASFLVDAFSVFDLRYDVGVLQVLHCFNLSLDKFHNFSIRDVLHDLDGNLSFINMKAQLDLAAGAITESS